jgi:small subunit ribosomal protein S3
MKKSLGATMKMGAEGIKIMCGGRLGGAEIARSEKYMEGRVPLHTLRADIDYSTSTAHTAYGCIGVKVWICRGEILDRLGVATEKSEEHAQREDGRHFQRREHREGGDRGDRGDRGGRRGGQQQQPQARGRIRKQRPRDDQGSERGPSNG